MVEELCQSCGRERNGTKVFDVSRKISVCERAEDEEGETSEIMTANLWLMIEEVTSWKCIRYLQSSESRKCLSRLEASRVRVHRGEHS